jgi:Permuted papain-like amidase enzyme, YaeF/YiiX, C92 family
MVDASLGPKSMSLEQLKDVAQTGDLLLFESKGLPSKMQRVLTRSKYDHVAMIVRASDQKIVVFESLRETGVSTCTWERFLTKKWYTNYQSIAYRPLKCNRDAKEFS